MSFRPQLGQPVTHRFLRRGTTEHNYDQPKREAIRQLLESKGYKRVRSWAEDDWYLLHGRYKANLDWGDADLSTARSQFGEARLRLACAKSLSTEMRWPPWHGCGRGLRV